MEKPRILEMIEKIKSYTDNSSSAKILHPFSIIGPSGKSNALRIYSYGGVAGEIGLGKAAGCTLCNRNYFINFGELLNDDERKLTSEWIKNSRKKDKEITGNWVEEVLDSEEYLNIVLKTIKQKFHKENDTEKERNIQMEILSGGNKRISNWEIVDVETGITKEWIENSSMIDTVKKPDFVVYDKSRHQFGIIELKFDNENTNNLEEHYSMFDAVYHDPDVFIAKICERAKIMSEYGLLDFDPNDVQRNVWFGFLFIGKGKDGKGIEGARQCINTYLLENISINEIEEDCRFLYADTVKQFERIGLCYENMQDIRAFMNR